MTPVVVSSRAAAISDLQATTLTEKKLVTTPTGKKITTPKKKKPKTSAKKKAKKPEESSIRGTIGVVIEAPTQIIRNKEEPLAIKQSAGAGFVERQQRPPSLDSDPLLYVQVLQYWSSIVRANAERIVQPCRRVRYTNHLRALEGQSALDGVSRLLSSMADDERRRAISERLEECGKEWSRLATVERRMQRYALFELLIPMTKLDELLSHRHKNVKRQLDMCQSRIDHLRAKLETKKNNLRRYQQLGSTLTEELATLEATKKDLSGDGLLKHCIDKETQMVSFIGKLSADWFWEQKTSLSRSSEVVQKIIDTKTT